MTRVTLNLCLLSFVAITADAAERVDYLKDVKPILRERCFACHAALKQESSLRLDTALSMKAGGDGGPVVVAGKPTASPLIDRVSADDESIRMPPEGEPLTPQQIAVLTRWIAQGAAAPADELAELDPRAHWAFQTPGVSRTPGVPSTAEPRNLVDAYIAAERSARELKPVSPADRRILLRRVHLDLVGAPPTREELHAFLADDRPDAYERVVDRLLASPAYGERWGRHWMDVWRYSDWYGLGDQLRNSQKHIWHWRDWIIESLNEDRGYDRMVREMLAADEIAPTDRSALRATGFLARNYYIFNRTTWLDETIEHTSKAFLGLTMNCAKCHDHKYDPLKHTDYYRMRAIFEPHQIRLDTWPGETNLEKNGLPRAFDAHPDALTYLHVRGNEKELDKSAALEPSVPAVLASDAFALRPVSLPVEAYRPALQAFVLRDRLAAAESEIAKARAVLESSRRKLTVIQAAAKVAATIDASPLRDDAQIFLRDEFTSAQPDVWEAGPGAWKYVDGRLVQSQAGATRTRMRARINHPRNFTATLNFRTTGGEKWKSVGLCFDVVDEREKLVYLSAVEPGSKLQVSYKVDAGHAFPAEGMQARPVKLNQDYTMQVAVRDRLVNVSLDGGHSIAYLLPVEREAGRFDVITFDATAEFDSVEVRELSDDVQLVQPGMTIETKAPATIAEAEAALRVAEYTLAAAEKYPDVLRTARAADVAKHRSPPENLTDLIRKAATAARRHELAKARVAVARAEQKLAAADDKQKAAIENELKTTHAGLQKAEKAIVSPGDSYPSLRASKKAAEGPDEKPESLNQPYSKSSTGRRRALAEWITDRTNPLTARVAVNHIWTRHFGQPLVDPVTDFGLRTPPPPQQKLLDALAVEFMETGWSMKHIHRLIVTSETYRLASSTIDADPATTRADPTNAFYWRRIPMRMRSQTIRDSLLHLTGGLRQHLGGPGVDPQKNADSSRRSLYFRHSRDDRHAFLAMFDDADIFACYRRKESIVPQQALTLANSRTSLSAAEKLTTQLQTELSGATDDAFITAAFESILCVEPTDEARTACREALHALTQTATKQNHPQPPHRARRDLVHALFNHNDFITIR